MIRPLMLLTALLLLPLVLSGCTREQAVAGSCSAGPLSDGSVVCIDYPVSGEMAQHRMACQSVMRGAWAERPCDAADALGGCRMNGGTIWIYPSQRYRTPDEAAAVCRAGATVVPAPR